ncbi:hypothetical protein ACVWZZ_000928 [Bradyrhizobium sp. LM6.10]
MCPLGLRPQPVGCVFGATPVRKVMLLPLTVMVSPSAGAVLKVADAVVPSNVAVPDSAVVPSAASAAVPVKAPAVEPSEAPSAAVPVTGVTPPGAPV